METPLVLKGLKHQADHALCLLVGIELILPIGPPYIPDRGMVQEGPAARLVLPRLQEPAFEEVEFGFAHHPSES